VNGIGIKKHGTIIISMDIMESEVLSGGYSMDLMKHTGYNMINLSDLLQKLKYGIKQILLVVMFITRINGTGVKSTGITTISEDIILNIPPVGGLVMDLMNTPGDNVNLVIDSSKKSDVGDNKNTLRDMEIEVVI
jgi:hypothetical protein